MTESHWGNEKIHRPPDTNAFIIYLQNLQTLREEIETVRMRLIETYGQANDLLHPSVIEISSCLDTLIVRYQQLLKTDEFFV